MNDHERHLNDEKLRQRVTDLEEVNAAPLGVIRAKRKQAEQQALLAAQAAANVARPVDPAVMEAENARIAAVVAQAVEIAMAKAAALAQKATDDAVAAALAKARDEALKGA